MPKKISGLQNPFIFTEGNDLAAHAAYTRLKDNLLYVTDNGSKKVIMVESAVENEAKTTTAINLACAIAKDGKKVLLIDADFRKGNLHKLFNVSRENGSTDMVVGKADMSTILKPTKVENLSLLTLGTKVSEINPAIILTNDVLAENFKKAKEVFDFIIVDCPPILASSDYLYISNLSDGVLFVASQKTSHKKHIREAMKQLKNNSIPVLAAVLTESETTVGGEYYYYYGRKEETAE